MKLNSSLTELPFFIRVRLSLAHPAELKTLFPVKVGMLKNSRLWKDISCNHWQKKEK
jgi:hypothetical protein